MFASLTAKVVTAVCAIVGAIALLGSFFMTLTGRLPYVESGLALMFFAMFLVGSYWWTVFGPRPVGAVRGSRRAPRRRKGGSWSGKVS
jgi:hypothetical protein